MPSPRPTRSIGSRDFPPPSMRRPSAEFPVRAKAKFVLATDGEAFEAEDLASGDTVACAFQDFPDHFDFFLPLAGITTVKELRESSFDIRATSRLNRLYVELLKDNPSWGTAMSAAADASPNLLYGPPSGPVR